MMENEQGVTNQENQENQEKPLRRYLPLIDQRVRMRLASNYSRLGLPPWTTLVAREIYNLQAHEGHTQIVCTREMTEGGKHDGERVTVLAAWLEPPIGWEPRYEINVSPEKLEMVKGWIESGRGIVVRQSQYIGDGSVSYQPLGEDGDVGGPSHWRFPEVTDVVKPEEVKDCIQVVKNEVWWGAGTETPCRYCNGTGKHDLNEVLREQDARDGVCEKCGLHLGFSTKRRWHSSPSSAYSSYDHCAESYSPGACWCCKETGRGIRYLSEMEPRKERKRGIEELKALGWQRIWYERGGEGGGTWMAERRRVVKKWGEDWEG